MASEIIPFAKAQPPKAMLERMRAGRTLTKNFVDNVQDSFARLSILGKVFSIRANGETIPYLNPENNKPYPELEVVLVNASEFMSKTYYKGEFEKDSNDPPDCWSLDAIKPDPSVRDKQNPTCPDCRWNALGSATSRNPKADKDKRTGKACADSRRVVVIRPDHIGSVNPQPLLLRVPQMSLRNLKNYAQVLDNYGWEPAAVVTKMSFDYNEAYPKLEFVGGRPLTEDEYAEVLKLADSEMVRSMLKAPDFDNVATKPANRDVRESASEREEMARPAAEPETAVQPEPAPTQPPAAEAPKRGRGRPPKKAEAAAPELTVVPAGSYRLPTGELVDEETGELLPEPAAKVQMPELDPNVTQWADGRYFHKLTKKFVVGPQLGAKEVGADEGQPMRRGRKPKLVEATPPVAEVEAEADQEAEEETFPQKTQAVNNASNGGESVVPASAGLDSILGTLVPGKNKPA